MANDLSTVPPIELCEELDGRLVLHEALRVAARLLHKDSGACQEPLLRPIFYLQTAVFSSGPAWTRTRDLFLIREAL
jgi:hypothetical protein